MKWVVAVLACVLWSGTLVALEQDDPRVLALVAELEKYKALNRAGKFAEALPHQERVAAGVRELHGEESRNYAVQLNNLAELHWSLGQYAKAAAHFEHSLKILEKVMGADHPDVGTSLNNLADLYRTMGQPARAEPLFLRSLKISEATREPDDPEVATLLNNLALLYQDLGQNAKAEPLLLRCVAIWEKQRGPDHPDVSTGLNNLGLLYRAMGQYAKAEPLFQRSLAIDEAALGRGHTHVAADLNNLAMLYKSMGQFARAETLYLRALATAENAFGPDHPEVASYLENLAVLYRVTGQYAKAAPLYERSLKLRAASQGEEHPEVATSLNNLAMLYQSMGEPAKAEAHLLRSAAILEKVLGPDHPEVATNANNLATVYQSTGRAAQAEPLLRRSLAILEKQMGSDHPNVSGILNSLASLQAGRGQWADALALTDRERRAQRRYLGPQLLAQSEEEQNQFLGQSSARLHSALTLGLHAAEHPPLASASAEWLLNFKGLLTEVRSERLRRMRQAESSGAKELAERWSRTRMELARALQMTPDPGEAAAWKTRVQDLKREDASLSKEVGRAVGADAGADAWIELPRLRAALPADGVWIGIARVDIFNFSAAHPQKQWAPARYAAWIVFPATEAKDVAIVDLGDAESIDAAVSAFRAVAERTQGDETARALRALAEKILHPLESHIARFPRWSLSPDGDLWLVPWAALSLANGAQVVDRHELNHLVSGREWVQPGYRLDTTGPAVFANPDFDLGAPATVAKPAKDEPLLITRSASLKGTFQPLPGTAREAERIQPALTAYAKAAPTVHLGTHASEKAFLALKRPKVLVLCTHGFALPKEVENVDPRTGERASKPGAENPLARCGLALAGANRRENDADGDDGILSGMEIIQADLRNADLVILSACQTALGEVNTGDGVAGLRQCFQLAGANSVLATLWQIPDAESADLMTLFLTHLSKGQRKSEALRNAQLGLVALRKAEGKSSHPYFWAAFTVTGR